MFHLCFNIGRCNTEEPQFPSNTKPALAWNIMRLLVNKESVNSLFNPPTQLLLALGTVMCFALPSGQHPSRQTREATNNYELLREPGNYAIYVGGSVGNPLYDTPDIYHTGYFGTAFDHEHDTAAAEVSIPGAEVGIPGVYHTGPGYSDIADDYEYDTGYYGKYYGK